MPQTESRNLLPVEKDDNKYITTYAFVIIIIVRHITTCILSRSISHGCTLAMLINANIVFLGWSNLTGTRWHFVPSLLFFPTGWNVGMAEPHMQSLHEVTDFSYYFFTS